MDYSAIIWLYLLVNVYRKLSKDPPLLMGKLTISMAMLNGYVIKLGKMQFLLLEVAAAAASIHIIFGLKFACVPQFANFKISISNTGKPSKLLPSGYLT